MTDETVEYLTETKKEKPINKSAFKKLTLSQSTKKRKHVNPIISPKSDTSIEKLQKSDIDQLDEIRAIVNIIDPIISPMPKISVCSFANLKQENLNGMINIPRSCMKSQNTNTKESKLLINKVSRKRINFDANAINEVKDNDLDLAPVDSFLNKENDIVSLSSGDDFQPSQKKVLSANANRKTIEKTNEKEKVSKTKEIKQPSTVKSKLNKQLLLVSQSCHKIDSFFTRTPKHSRILNDFETPCTSRHAEITNSKKAPVQKPVKYEIGVPINRMQKIDIKRKLTKHTNLTRISKKYFTNDQKRIPNFFLERKDDSLIGYYTTIKNSLFPIIITGDLDISKFLTILINNEENENVLNKFDIIDDKKCIIVSPKESVDIKVFEKIDTKLSQQKINDKIVYFKNFVSTDTETEISTEMHEVHNLSNKSDCEIVNASVDDVIELLDSDDTSENIITNVAKSIDAKDTKQLTKQSELNFPTKLIKNKTKPIKSKCRRKTIVCPEYKIIAGTTFAVDAFRFGNIEGVTEYFLTHFHADHYIGLTKGFNKPIYLSEITARLVRSFIKTSDEFLRVIEINKPIIIKNIEITALDANHCPGAIVLIFKFPNGKCILHTGDFRASPEMEEEPFYWNNDIDTVYLDTTYLTSKYDFQSQWDSIKFILDHIGEYVEKNIENKFLIVCGSYLIGKEKVWLNIATKFHFKVWLEPKRRKAVACINDEEMTKVIVDEPEDANIHVLTMGKINYDYLIEYRKQFDDVFSNIIAIRPSGWEKNSKPQYRGIITIIGVEYSEHSSYNELKRFIRFLRPNNVISTVPYGNNILKTPKIPSNWMLQEIKPIVNGYQSSITNYIKVCTVLLYFN